MSVVVLLAHMDDEVFILPYLRFLATKSQLQIFFLTKSEGRNRKFHQSVREHESLSLIQQIAPNATVEFLGRKLEVEDLRAHEKAEVIYKHLRNELSDTTIEILTPNYEGGHIDHDTTCYIAVKLSNELSTKLGVFNLYRSKFKKTSIFQVMSKRDKNSESLKARINLRDLVLILKIPIIYRSQWRTWIGIYPFLLFKQIFNQGVWLHYPKQIDFNERPNSGRVLYSKRKDGMFENWKTYIKNINN